MVDNQLGVRQLLSHLIQQHGCRRIAHLYGPKDHIDACQRMDTYRTVLAEFGLENDNRLVEGGGFSTEDGRRAVSRLLLKGATFDAIFAADDETAAGALQELASAGIAVPEQVRVVGFDDLHLAESLTPPLTTVHSPIEEVAFTAAELVLRSVQGEAISDAKILPAELVLRRSCGCQSVVH
jgi:DNA-binding LacI/PurR family transcriptional regulator